MGVPVNASSGRTRRSRFVRDAEDEARRESARAMFSSTRPSLGENWSVAIRMVWDTVRYNWGSG